MPTIPGASNFEQVNVVVYDVSPVYRSRFDLQADGIVQAAPVVVPPPVVPVSTVLFTQVDPLADGGQFGVDVATVPELSESFQLISGRRAIAENVYRRLTTARGQMAFHPADGIDLRMYLNDAMTEAGIFAIIAAVEAEAKRDERVLDATAKGSYVRSTETLTIQVQLRTAVGPFALVLNVTAVAVTLQTEGT